jgi:hypothetical protein
MQAFCARTPVYAPVSAGNAGDAYSNLRLSPKNLIIYVASTQHDEFA